MQGVNLIADVGRAAHCRRVAAYCDEIASNLKLPARDRSLLRQLAMRHHAVPRAFGSRATERLALDLGLTVTGASQAATRFDQLLSAFSGEAKGAPDVMQLAALVDVADDLDTEIEFLAYGNAPGGHTLSHAARDLFEHPAVGALLPDFRRFSRQQLAVLAKDLPVFPAVARQVIRTAREGSLSASLIAELAARDQVMTGSILAAANAAAYTWSGTVRTVQAAVLYLGEARAAGVVLAAALKPVLRSAGFQDLWEHSMATAAFAEEMARIGGELDPGDAYSIGLVHDIGRLLMELAPPQVTAARERLVRNGCASAVAEVLTCGATHAEAGADVLRHWALPAEYIEAVEFHHEPEHAKSRFASLLYLAEQSTGSEEDLPSAARLTHALDQVGMSAEQFELMTATAA